MGNVTILEQTTKNPITHIGEMAGVCWGSDTKDPEKNYRRGWDCIESGHGRVLEFVTVEAVLDGYSARVMREWYTHIGGMPTRLQASTRYIDYGEFEYVTPESVKGDARTWQRYDCAMKEIQHAIKALEEMDVPREDAALLLPLGMTTRVVDRRNLRSLMDMSRQRMCNRAYWEFRMLFRDVSCALVQYSEEWARIVNRMFMPKCMELGYCPEKKGCGMMRWKGDA